jgi:hypothetical protein
LWIFHRECWTFFIVLQEVWCTNWKKYFVPFFISCECRHWQTLSPSDKSEKASINKVCLIPLQTAFLLHKIKVWYLYCRFCPVICVIVKNMLFLSTHMLHFRERICLIKMRYFQRIWRITLFFFILVPHIYNPILNIKAAMYMKGYANYWTPLRMHTGR